MSSFFELQKQMFTKAEMYPRAHAIITGLLTPQMEYQMSTPKVKKHPHRTLFTEKQYDFLKRYAGHMDMTIQSVIRLAVQNLRNKELKNLPDIIEE